MRKIIRRSFHKKTLHSAVAWFAVATLSGLLALSQAGAPSGGAGRRPDGQIEKDVVRALDSSKALNKEMITAETSHGEVTLSGTVSGEASSELAELIVSQVPGVAKVHNNLRFANSAAPQGAANAPRPNTQSAAGVVSTNAVSPPPAPAGEGHSGPVTISQGTLLRVRTNESVDSKRAKEGTPIRFTVIHNVGVGGMLAIPRGATVHGVVTEVRKPGELSGSADLALEATSLDLGGRSYALESDLFKVKGPSKTGEAVHNIFGGALLGALVGGIADRGVGAAIGATAGAGAGTAATAATPGPGVWIPAEALVDFHLKTPLTVTPVSAQEAARLAQGLYPGGPALYRRGYAPGGLSYASPPPYYYAYPPVFYRPYYVEGGFYYWR